MEVQLVLIGVGVALVGVVILSSLRHTGRMGINLSARACPVCGTPAEGVRTPTSFRQALWGGWTCAKCGAELDKWGAEVAKRGA
jgi:hypothetical protein